jgi:hypothetical protein
VPNPTVPATETGLPEDNPRRGFLRGIIGASAIGAAAVAGAAIASPAPSADPLFALIDAHRVALKGVEDAPDEDVEDVFFDRQESLIQQIGRTMPRTLAGAAAMLLHVAEREGDHVDKNSPITHAMATVAAALLQFDGGRPNV